MISKIAFLGCAAGLIFAGTLCRAEAPSLSLQEQEKGWKLLFNGEDLAEWRSFKKKEGPEKGWVVENGALKHVAKGGGADIISDAEFGDFELTWEWMVAQGANSGLKYFISEERSQAIGHEYQLIDDARHPDAKLAQGKRVTASFYDVLAPKDRKTHEAGEWNTSRVLVKGNHVEHWLNGGKVLEYELGSPELEEAVSKSKFKTVKGFGTKIKGHILLQDHGDEITFRNIKIRDHGF